MYELAYNFEDSYKSITNLLDAQPGSELYDRELIKRAFDLCVKSHDGQFRASGEPFCMHPISVAQIIITLGMDSENNL